MLAKCREPLLEEGLRPAATPIRIVIGAALKSGAPGRVIYGGSREGLRVFACCLCGFAFCRGSGISGNSAWSTRRLAAAQRALVG